MFESKIVKLVIAMTVFGSQVSRADTFCERVARINTNVSVFHEVENTVTKRQISSLVLQDLYSLRYEMQTASETRLNEVSKLECVRSLVGNDILIFRERLRQGRELRSEQIGDVSIDMTVGNLILMGVGTAASAPFALVVAIAIAEGMIALDLKDDIANSLVDMKGVDVRATDIEARQWARVQARKLLGMHSRAK